VVLALDHNDVTGFKYLSELAAKLDWARAQVPPIRGVEGAQFVLIRPQAR
jgi:hypothetical protein